MAGDRRRREVEFAFFTLAWRGRVAREASGRGEETIAGIENEGGEAMTLWIVLAVAVAVLIYAIYVYTRLVSLAQLSSEGWSGIDVQLKRRSDLVPGLVDSVKGYAAHERGVLEQVTKLREQARALPQNDVTQRAQAEGQLTAALGKLIALAEAYPDLKASGNFLELQKQLSELENELQMSRRYYNGAVRNQNTLIQSFPSNLVAGVAGFRPRDYFEIADQNERAVPQVSLGR
jgi:LemA protein